MLDFYSEIRRIAQHFDRLQKADDAKVRYQPTSGSLIWSDELPSEDFGDDQAIKYLLRYRTSIIIGIPIETIEPYWDAALQAFPNWPGFCSERCEYSEAIKVWFEKQRRVFDDSLNQAFDSSSIS